MGDVKNIISRKEYFDVYKSFPLKGFRDINSADLNHTDNNDIKRITAVVYRDSSSRSKRFKNISPDKLTQILGGSVFQLEERNKKTEFKLF